MKTIIASVISDKMTNTVVVSVDRLSAHPMYHKRMRSTKKFHAHDEMGAKMGDTVEIVETKPISKTKFWKVIKIVSKKEVITKPVVAQTVNVEEKPKAVKAEKVAKTVKPVKKVAKK